MLRPAGRGGNGLLMYVHGDVQDEVEAKVGSFSKAMKELGSSEERNTEEAKSLYTDLHNFQQMMPITGGPFVELFLGKMNVRFPRRKER